MKCPECGGGTQVIDSRKMEGYVWRSRKCKDCGVRVSSIEILAGYPLPSHGKFVKELKRTLGDEAIDQFKESMREMFL